VPRAYDSAMLPQIGKILVLLGGAMIVVGFLMWGLGRLGFGRLPGDIHVEGRNVSFYFPVVSCIVLSLLLTLLVWLWRWWR